MNRYGLTACLTAAAVLSVGVPFRAEAASNYEMRRKVIRLSGIMSLSDETAMVTRGEYAQMLLNASTYKSVALQTSSTAVFSDVPSDSTYASAVRIAAEKGWMKGYLGGVFRPDEQITLQEAVRGILALLEYTDEDFSGNQIGGRWAKFNYLELNENIAKEPLEVLTRMDCVNLFYNLLSAETASGKAYCTLLGYELSGNGDVNPLTIADYELKGPKVVKKSYSLSDYVPFDLNQATFYLDGQISTIERVKREEIGSNMTAVLGEISGIFYNSSDVLTPTTVILDDDENTQFRLEDADVQFAFSIYGEFQVGDHVILICEKSGTTANGDESYTVIDYIEY